LAWGTANHYIRDGHVILFQPFLDIRAHSPSTKILGVSRARCRVVVNGEHYLVPSTKPRVFEPERHAACTAEKVNYTIGHWPDIRLLESRLIIRA